MGSSVPLAMSIAALVVTQDLLLDLMDLVRGPLEPVDALIILGAVQANVAPILAQPALQFEFGALPDMPPDTARRPVSISGLAGALGLPFETVRRRLLRLSEAGICDITPAGVVVPARQLHSPIHTAGLLALDGTLSRAWRRLAEMGFLEPGSLPVPLQAPGPTPLLRAQARIAGEYLMRMMPQVERRFGGLIPGLIALQMLRENAAGLVRDPAGPGPEARQPWLPDGVKRPVSVTLVATRLRLQNETVRRHVRRLTERGLVGQVGRGFIVLADGLDDIGVAEVIPENNVSLSRLFRDLARIGAVQAWENA